MSNDVQLAIIVAVIAGGLGPTIRAIANRRKTAADTDLSVSDAFSKLSESQTAALSLRDTEIHDLQQRMTMLSRQLNDATAATKRCEQHRHEDRELHRFELQTASDRHRLEMSDLRNMLAGTAAGLRDARRQIDELKAAQA